MKKILALILAALMVLTMVACAAKAEPAADAEQTTDGTGCLTYDHIHDIDTLSCLQCRQRSGSGISITDEVRHLRRKRDQ